MLEDKINGQSLIILKNIMILTGYGNIFLKEVSVIKKRIILYGIKLLQGKN